MKILKRRLKLILSVCLVLASISSYGQDEKEEKDDKEQQEEQQQQEGPYQVGIILGADHMIVSNTPSFKAGFIYEWVPKWCGIETGISWRSQVSSLKFKTENGMYRSTVNSYYITIPFLWRVKFKSINFSIGPEIDYYVNYKVNESKTDTEVTVTDYSEDRVSLGGIFKMGVPIQISDNWLIEPEIRAGFNYSRDFFVGVGVAIKFGK